MTRLIFAALLMPMTDGKSHLQPSENLLHESFGTNECYLTGEVM
jgi:hypothetical protein